MPRLAEPGVDAVYAAAQAFVDAALRNDDSLFDPGRPVWSLSVLEDLHARFVGHPDESSRPFEAKFRDQLQDAGPETVQLAAELVFVHLLAARGMHGATKRSLIQTVLSWSSPPVLIPERLNVALETGITNVGAAFMTRRPYQLQFLLETLIAWKRLDLVARNHLLEDAWAFRGFVFGQPIRFAQTQREVLLHLVFPDTFESIASEAAKERIAATFSEYVLDETENVDRKLIAIRKALEPKFGQGFHFYAPQVKPLWQADDSPWTQFSMWAERFTAWPSFDASERDYKLRIGERFARARDALLANDAGWLDLFRQAFTAPNNLISWRDHDHFLKWCARDPQTAAEALTTLWDPQSTLENRLTRFFSQIPGGTISMQTAFASVLLMADGADHPVFRLTAFQKGFRLTGYADFPPSADPDAFYAHALGFLDRILEEARVRGLDLRDRLDAQSVLWCITRWRPTEEPVASWSPADRRAYLRFRGEVEPDAPDGRAVDTWIYQANPIHYDIAGAIAVLPELSWTLRQHAQDVHTGHTVYIWESGPEAGVIGVATVVSEPGAVADDGAGERFNRGEALPEKDYPLIRLHIDQSLPRRILRRELVDHPILGDLAIIKMWRGTNYPVTAEQAAALRELVHHVLNQPPERPTPGRTFSDLMRVLEEDGLHFPEELVANYLLALQTKRFVILSGISGTGKTRLAIEVARYFQPMATVSTPVRVPEGAFEVPVQPYMARHHQWAFLAELRHALHIPALESGDRVATIDVQYGSTKTEQRVYRDAQASFWQMSLTGSLRTWFDRNLKVGDRFFAEVVRADDDQPDGLRLSLPELVTRQAPLNNYAVVAVRPDWTDHRGLLGFFNPLTNRYTVTPFLRLVLDAQKETEQAQAEARLPHPFFVILDEMNLARVEHYFSDFLSALESGEMIDLHQDPTVEAGENDENIAVPRRLRVPPNLVFTGTVNIDETTYMFSPKVLDRAFTLELNQVDLPGYRDRFSLTEDETSSILALVELPDQLQLERLPGAEDWDAFKDLDSGALHAFLLDLHEVLAADHRHFGYRVANEIARFVTLAGLQARQTPKVLWTALDLAILQKTLPKFHGTQQELEQPLRSLFEFAVNGKQDQDPGTDPDTWGFSGLGIRPIDIVAWPDLEPRLPRTAAKLWRMLRRLERQGFTSFIE